MNTHCLLSINHLVPIIIVFLLGREKMIRLLIAPKTVFEITVKIPH